jgi:HEAT repeat protein
MFVAPLTLALMALPAKEIAIAVDAVEFIGKRPWFPPPPPPPDSGPSKITVAPGGPGDASVLKTVKIDVTDSSLLNFFRKRTPPAPDREKIVDAVKKLSSKTSADRDEGQAELIAIGLAAVPVLRQTANNVDEVEACARARECLQAIEGASSSAIVIHAARLLGARKPTGAAEVLMNYLPYADDDAVFTEVEQALVAVAMKSGKVDPAILKALKDKVALRRGAAAHIVCKAGGSAYHTSIRPLLKDERGSVRLRAALGLVSAYDSEAITVLIDLLGELPPRLRPQVEDYLTQLAGEWAVSGPKGNDLMARKLRRDVWAAWWKNTDGATLLNEFKSRTMSDEDREKAVALLRKLEDSSADVRNAASNDLITMGKKVSPLLRRAVADDHPKVARFAAKCLEAIEKETPNPLPKAAARLLALRKPEGTVATLVAYLPFAESEDSANHIIDVLTGAGVVGGKPDESLVKALEDKVAIRRIAAVLALTKGNAEEHKAAVKKLLKDKDLDVRMRTAQALAMAGDKAAVPVLITLLSDLPLEKASEVEDFLVVLGGEKSPAVSVGPDADSRSKAVAAWRVWWKANEKTVDLASAVLGERQLGYMLVVENYNPTNNLGRVMELDASGKVRWELKNLYYPWDARRMQNGNILVIEGNGNQVTERDPKTGKEVWKRFHGSAFSCQPLRNGDYFLACRNQLLVIDKNGKQIFSHFYNTNTILGAKRFRDGSMAFIDYSGNYVRLDKAGKELKKLSFPIAGLNPYGAEILPGDRIILNSYNNRKVTEFNSAGKAVWECSVDYPGQFAHRLPNGRTMVVANTHSTPTIVEIDRTGKIVSELKGLSYRPLRVSKR